MLITINGEQKTCEAPLNIEDCLAQNGYTDMTVAVAHNGTFVPKGQYGQTVIEDGDDIEIVAPMQGG